MTGRPQHWDAKLTDRDRPPRMAGRYITRDEATASAIVLGLALGLAVVVVLAVLAHDYHWPPTSSAPTETVAPGP